MAEAGFALVALGVLTRYYTKPAVLEVTRLDLLGSWEWEGPVKTSLLDKYESGCFPPLTFIVCHHSWWMVVSFFS